MTLNVSLTPHLEQFVHATVGTGRFRSASEVVRTALRLLEANERERKLKLDSLTGEIQKGLASGPAEPFDDGFWDDLRGHLQQRTEAQPHD